MLDRLLDNLEGWNGLIVAVVAAGWLFGVLRRWLSRPEASHDSQEPIEPK